MNNYKHIILDNLKALAAIERANKQFFKVKAYTNVVKQIEAVDTPITSIEDLNNIAGIGQGIKEKLLILFQDKNLNVVEQGKNQLEIEKSIDVLTTVMGIGEVKARSLVETHNITTIEQLRTHTDLLNENQKLGLKYHDDFIKRIPRKEMDRHQEYLEKIIPTGYQFTIAGSYRRELASSGDIDVLITGDKEFSELMAILTRDKYLVGHFANGAEKYLGIAKLPRFKTHRRIDILYIPKEKYAFALLYFTGSQQHNIKMRNMALEKGYSLSEHGLKYMNGENKGQFVDQDFPTEQSIYEFLGMEYVAPKDRK